MKINNAKNKTYIEYLLPFFLLFSQYSISGLPISTLLLGVVAVLTFLKNGFKFQRHYIPFIGFFLYVIMHDVMAMMFGGSNPSTCRNRLIEYSVNCILILVVCAVAIDENKLYKTWKIATLIYSLGLIYHLYLIYVTIQPVEIIKILPFLENVNLNEPFRPRSFFNEPSYIAEAILPMLFLSLKRKDYIWGFFTTIMIFLSTSSIGIALAFVLWVYSFISFNKKSKKNICLAIILIGCIMLVFSGTGLFDASLEKFEDALSGGSTFEVRVIMGFSIIKHLPAKNIVFGTLFNEVADYIATNAALLKDPLIFKYWEMGSNVIFMNSISSIIFRYGVVGLLAFTSTYAGMLFDKKYGARAYAITIVISLFANSYILNAPYYIHTMILLLYLNENNLIKEK